MVGSDNPAFSGCRDDKNPQRSHGNDPNKRLRLGPRRIRGLRSDTGRAMVACILTARITGAVSIWVRPSRAAISPVMYS